MESASLTSVALTLRLEPVAERADAGAGGPWAAVAGSGRPAANSGTRSFRRTCTTDQTYDAAAPAVPAAVVKVCDQRRREEPDGGSGTPADPPRSVGRCPRAPGSAGQGRAGPAAAPRPCAEADRPL